MNGNNKEILTEISLFLDKYQLPFIYVVDGSVIRICIFMGERDVTFL